VEYIGSVCYSAGNPHAPNAQPRPAELRGGRSTQAKQKRKPGFQWPLLVVALLVWWTGGAPRIAPGTDGEREVFEDHEARPSQRRRGGSWHVAAAEATRYGRSLRSAMASTRQLAR